MRAFGPSPSADEIEAIARRALANLPEPFCEHLADVVLQVDDFADDETLRAMGIDDPFDLSGLYEGIPPHRRPGCSAERWPSGRRRSPGK